MSNQGGKDKKAADKQEGQEFIDNKYVHRLMRARCSCGSMDNYLNIETDHGVLAGEDQEPLMNANDHIAGVNVIHFGNCNSDENPERVFRKNLVGGLLGGGLLGGLVSDALEDIGIMSFKCTPKTDEVWEQTNDRNILDGAPALLMGSCLTCRYGGSITLVPEDEYPQEDSEEKSNEGTDNEEEQAETDTVKEETDAVLEAAMERIAATGEEGQEAVMEAQTLMAISASSTATKAASIYSAIKGKTSSIYESAMLKAITCSADQREKNYAHNKSITFGGDYLDSNGMITDQSAMTDFHFNNFLVSNIGGAAIAAYNACKILEQENAPSFADVIYELEPYGLLSSTYGLMSAGIGDYFIKKGYDVSYEVKDIGKKAQEADLCILSSTKMEGSMGTRMGTLKKKEDGKFDAYNLGYRVSESKKTLEEITEDIYPSAMLGITVSKSTKLTRKIGGEEKNELYRRSNTISTSADGAERKRETLRESYQSRT